MHRFPEHPDATHFLGLLAHQAGHDEQALPLLEKAVALGPASALYRHNLAGVLREAGRHAEAEARYREALTLNPGYTDAFIGLAMVQAARGNYQAAQTLYQRALSLEPGNFEAHMGCGSMLLELAHRRQALEHYREARRLASGNAELLHRLGSALRDAGAMQDALQCLQAAVSLRPDFVAAHNSLGAVLGDLGELTSAEHHYRAALQLRPDYASGWHNLASIVQLKPEDSLWPALQEYRKHLDDLPPAEACMLEFALGKICDDQGAYSRAFEHYLNANRLKRRTIEYDEQRQADFFQEFARYFEHTLLSRFQQAGTQSDLPVFIVGMSRSGTTLVEQILSSHPSVHGAGELQLLPRCLRVQLGPTGSDDQMPARLAQLGTDGLRRIGEHYCRELAQLAPGAARITDKLPGNMALVGLIHMAFPRARIIHCVRDPLDTCISCFSKLFTTGHAFSYELAELGRFYRLYSELMRHWQTVLPPGRMLEVRYEQVVNDTEGQARRLLEYCDLPWDPACLQFHSHRRTVKTASLAQVRQPMYASSIGRWRRYARYLGPLREALGQLEA
ncbi:MAG: sulfotransferase [Gammaproteobacteria bacterium]|nr:sulfotransferase [Gammaproteobacteria bacterium]